MLLCEIRKLRKTYPSFTLSDMTFSLDYGRIVGFIGRNGAGKTTTIKSILGLVHPDGGDIRYFGLPFSGHEKEIKQRIGYSTGAVNYYPKKKIRDIVDVTRAFFDTWDEDAYEEYLSLFALDENKMPSELSEGMRVKFNLLLALSHKAEILILDEPTRGVDVNAKQVIHNVVKDYVSKGNSVILLSSDLPEVVGLADRAVILREGHTIGMIRKKDMTENSILIAANGEGEFVSCQK